MLLCDETDRIDYFEACFEFAQPDRSILKAHDDVDHRQEFLKALFVTTLFLEARAVVNMQLVA